MDLIHTSFVCLCFSIRSCLFSCRWWLGRFSSVQFLVNWYLYIEDVVVGILQFSSFFQLFLHSQLLTPPVCSSRSWWRWKKKEKKIAAAKWEDQSVEVLCCKKLFPPFRLCCVWKKHIRERETLLPMTEIWRGSEMLIPFGCQNAGFQHDLFFSLYMRKVVLFCWQTRFIGNQQWKQLVQKMLSWLLFKRCHHDC